VILRRELYPAMKRAGVPRVGPAAHVPRIAIENNRPTFWLSKHLGHSSFDVTSNVYGHFEKATRRREAEEMAGLFGV
jgi:integrase